MNINLDLYRIFYVVAKNGSISSAADVLYISQPAITFQIKKLEAPILIIPLSKFLRFDKAFSPFVILSIPVLT